MLYVFKQTLHEVVGSSRALTVFEAEMRRLVLTKAVAVKIVKSVLSNIGFIVQIEEIAGKMVKSAVDDYRLSAKEELSTSAAQDEP